MRITFLCTSSLNDASPRGRWLPIAKQLQATGHTIQLLMLHPTWDRLQQRSQLINGVLARYVAQMHVYGYPGARRYYKPMELIAVSLRAALALAAAAIQERPELIYIAKPQPINGMAGLIAARILGIPLIVDCDDYEAGANRFSAEWQRQLVAFWEDRLPHYAKLVSINTHFLEQHFRQLGIPASKLLYIPNGIHKEQIGRPASTNLLALRSTLGLTGYPTLVYVGTMSEVSHGVGLLLDAMQIVQQQQPEAHLLLVGDGDDRQILQQRAAAHRLQHIIWTGKVTPQAAQSFLALADASTDPVTATAVMAARSPLKIAESLAVGVPIITGNVGDRQELIGNAGLLVEPNNPQALASGIKALLANQERRQAMALAAIQQAQQLRWDYLTKPLINWIENRAS